MRIPVLRGREFQDYRRRQGHSGRHREPKLSPANSSADTDPIGKHITPGISDGGVKEVPREIIAVVGDVKASGLKKDISPEYYLPFAQAVVLSPNSWFALPWIPLP